MGNDLVSLFLDVVVLLLLGATIFYVIRLTKGLQDFRNHRHEFDSVIANLLSSIDQADRSVRTLKKVSNEEAGRLENSIVQAKALSEELKIINEAGESMAKRLEKLAETNRKIAQQTATSPSSFTRYEDGNKKAALSHKKSQTISSPIYNRERPEKHAGKVWDDDAEEVGGKSSYDSTLKRVDKEKAAKVARDDMPSFMIKDKEFDDIDSLGDRLDSSASNDGSKAHSEQVIPKKLQSQAEKELFDALRSGKKNIPNKGF